MTHIVHVYDGHEPAYGGRRGSVPTVVWNVARETARLGHRVTVVERRWRDTPARETVDGVDIVRIAVPTGTDEPWRNAPYELVRTPWGALRLLGDRTVFALVAHRALRRLAPDVVHAHLPFAANVLARLGWADRLVYTAHLGETRKRVVEPRVSPDVLLARRAARTVVLNEAMHDAFADRGVPPARLHTIPNGVEVGRFGTTSEGTVAALRERYGAPLALAVGTVTPRKGTLDLVRAFAETPEGHLVVAGTLDLDPDYVAAVRAAIADAGLESRVTLTGFIAEADLLALFDAADCFVLPTYEEGSSIAVAEALAAGLPVVSTTIPGVAQLVEDGTHGLLSPPGDTAALAANLARLLGAPDERARMRAAVAARATDLAWPEITARIAAVYDLVAPDGAGSEVSVRA